jgi:hypothetical protein
MIGLVLWLAAQPATLSQVMERTARYVAEFEQRLSGIVAEEQYVQEVRVGQPTAARPLAQRRLQSDLLLLRPIGGDEWMQFRDVFVVDGEPVRDRQERLTEIFLNPTETTATQAATILAESARYNIGALERTVNVPLLTLRFLEAANQPRFTFHRTAAARPNPMTLEAPAPRGHFQVSTEVWVIEFRERQTPTLIRTRDRSVHSRLADLPARGRFWIEPDTGRILMSEVILDADNARGIITVNYQSEPLLGVLVPIEMRERYDHLKNKSVIEGYASYGHFRQFQVLVDEKLGPIKK